MKMTDDVVKKLLVLNDEETGSRIRARRLKLGVSQIDLAKKLKVCQAEISNVENGYKTAISVYDYCKVLDVTPKFIISG